MQGRASVPPVRREPLRHFHFRLTPLPWQPGKWEAAIGATLAATQRTNRTLRGQRNQPGSQVDGRSLSVLFSPGLTFGYERQATVLYMMPTPRQRELALRVESAPQLHTSPRRFRALFTGALILLVAALALEGCGPPPEMVDITATPASEPATSAPTVEAAATPKPTPAPALVPPAVPTFAAIPTPTAAPTPIATPELRPQPRPRQRSCRLR